MAKRKVTPDFITGVWKILQTHYFLYMNSGGSHAEYVNVNGLTDEEGENLLKAYKRVNARKKKS